jgi:dissimilatory sulfite reductase related protein
VARLQPMRRAISSIPRTGPRTSRKRSRSEGIDLTDGHWKVIHFMRRWLDEHSVAPDARHVMKFLAGDREAGRVRVFELFPYGYVKQACKIAGMKRPRVWSTG